MDAKYTTAKSGVAHYEINRFVLDISYVSL